MRKELLPNSRFATALNKTISLFIFQSTHFCDISIINDFKPVFKKKIIFINKDMVEIIWNK